MKISRKIKIMLLLVSFLTLAFKPHHATKIIYYSKKNYVSNCLPTSIMFVDTVKVKSDLNKLGLKGKVKSYQEILLAENKINGKIIKLSQVGNYKTFNEKGNLIDEHKYNKDESLHNKKSYKYNQNGDLIEFKSLKPDGKTLKATTLRTFTYIYDEKGNKVEKTEYYSNREEPTEFRGRETYKYDEQGNVIDEKVYVSDGKLYMKSTFKFGQKRNVIEAIIEEPNSVYGVLKITHKYDEKGNEISFQSEQEHDENFRQGRFEEFKYDEKGNKIIFRSEQERNENFIKSEIEYKYNERDSLIERKESSFKGLEKVKISLTSYEYKYDEKDNLIEKRIYYNKDGVNTFEEVQAYENKYNEKGILISQSPLGNKNFIWIYDEKGNLIERQENYIIFKYDSEKNVISESYNTDKGPGGKNFIIEYYPKENKH